MNLWRGVRLAWAKDIDPVPYLQKLDGWTELVRRSTERWWPRFVRSPGEFDNSPGQFRMLSLVTVLQRDIGVRYNLAFMEGDYNGTDSRNLFIHGLLSGHGGTSVTMPVLYIAVGRRLGYPLKLVKAKGHLFARWEQSGGERFNIESTSQGFSPETMITTANGPSRSQTTKLSEASTCGISGRARSWRYSWPSAATA